jgi:hypothetical protein
VEADRIIERIVITSERVQRFIVVYEDEPTDESRRLVLGAMADLREELRKARAAGVPLSDVEAAAGQLPSSRRFERVADRDAARGPAAR